MAALTQLFYEDWANLPDPILTQVFSYLSEVERCRVGATCKHWLQFLETPQLWRTFNCVFELPEDRKQVKCLEKYGHFISSLTISINYEQEKNKNNALAVLKHLSCLENVRLSHLSIVFNGSSAWSGDCYFGKPLQKLFGIALQKLFTKIGEKNEKSTLKHLNLPSFAGYFNDKLLDKISATCPNLEYLNFVSRVAFFKLYVNNMVMLVLKCRKIQELHVYFTHLSDDVLKALSETDRKPLQRLGVICTIDDEFEHELSSAAWSTLLTANPDLKVSLKFEYGSLLKWPSKIMKPEIPVQELYLTTTMFDPAIHLQINKAVAYYEQMLEKLVVKSSPSRELQESLLDVARRCKNLKALYVYCVLDKDVIDRILELCPLMRDTRDYFLECSTDAMLRVTECLWACPMCKNWVLPRQY
ncbi:hypothetical protein BsWGS_16307 [Bradybaena similaris]